MKDPPHKMPCILINSCYAVPLAKVDIDLRKYSFPLRGRDKALDNFACLSIRLSSVEAMASTELLNQVLQCAVC